jgi:hypothetical protein
MKEYGELMNQLLYSRDDYRTEEEFRAFMIDSIRTFVYDLRDFDIEISLSVNSTRRQPVNSWGPTPEHAQVQRQGGTSRQRVKRKFVSEISIRLPKAV